MAKADGMDMEVPGFFAELDEENDDESDRADDDVNMHRV